MYSGLSREDHRRKKHGTSHTRLITDLNISIIIWGWQRIKPIDHAWKFLFHHAPCLRILKFHPEPDDRQFSHQFFSRNAKFFRLRIELLGFFGAKLNLDFLSGLFQFRHQIVGVHFQNPGQFEGATQAGFGATSFISDDLRLANAALFGKIFLGQTCFGACP
ncbi:hypothetical protein A462_04931 [Pseudomonas sp. Ag1]|nr:hypothetical protein A462_04931 [Pseudomonas sp. Ag1]